MARAMLDGLPLALWSEAINTAVYSKNRVPHKAVKESTPYEALHGNKPRSDTFNLSGASAMYRYQRNSVALVVSYFPEHLKENS